MFLVELSGKVGEPGSPPPAEVEDAHVRHLKELQRGGHLHFVGHDAAGIKGYALLSAKDEQQATSLICGDPLLTSGYYTDMRIVEIEAPYPARV